MNDNPTRQRLKQDLLHQISLLGQQALLPEENSSLNAMVQQLEALNPTPAPLAIENWALLLGNWQLVYATRGTVVTRRLPGGIAIDAIWQRLDGSSATTLAVTNGATLQIPLLGQLQLQAQGQWRWQGETQTATVAFDAFALGMSRLLYQADWQLPVLKLPVLEAFRREASWQTSYLDADLRVGRGATGNGFVLVRSPIKQ